MIPLIPIPDQTFRTLLVTEANFEVTVARILNEEARKLLTNAPYLVTLARIKVTEANFKVTDARILPADAPFL
ncbi:MAG: hypothetical protein ACKOC0_12385, partial [Cytophagales bacterium]